MNIIKEVLRASASSAQAPNLRLMQKNGYFDTRAQIHVMLILPFGAGKTTGIVKLPASRFHLLTEYTAPGMLGTILKDGRYSVGEIVKAAGKCVGLDEFQKYSWKSKEALLNLLEQQFYVRNLGYPSTSAIKQKRKFYSIELKQGDNTMRIFSRFSCIATGMFKPNIRMNALDDKRITTGKIAEWAFMSRFIPVSLKLDLESMYKVISGNPVFTINRVDNYSETPVFDDYLKLVEQHMKIAKDLPFIDVFGPDKYGIITRNCLDIARLSAYDSRNSGSVENWDKWLNFVPFFAYNSVFSTLTNNEYLVLNSAVFENLGDSEIAQKMGFSRAYISKVLSRLRGLGLLIHPEKLLLNSSNTRGVS